MQFNTFSAIQNIAMQYYTVHINTKEYNKCNKILTV